VFFYFVDHKYPTVKTVGNSRIGTQQSKPKPIANSQRLKPWAIATVGFIDRIQIEPKEYLQKQPFSTPQQP
jgi:hypothetical protein